MYCSRCGKELREGSRFCAFCGYPVPLQQDEMSVHGEGQTPAQQPTASPEQPAGNVNPDQNSFETNKDKTGRHCCSNGDGAEQKTQEKSQSCKKSQTGSRKGIIFGTLAVLLIIGIGIGGYFGIREYQYRNALASAESAFADRDYDEAIALFEELIQIRPEASGNYLMLAQAYLESENLYAAKQTLEKGYAATGDEELQNVSLWGPVSAFEISMWASESCPLTRQEYRFDSQNIVQGYVSMFGSVMFVMSYYFDNEGNVAHVVLTDYTSNILGVDGVNRTLLETGWPFMGTISQSWDYIYDGNGNIISVNIDGMNITIKRDAERSVELSSGDDQITVLYNSEGRPDQISFFDGTSYSWSYQEDGGCIAEYLDADYWYEFDENGLFIALVGDDAEAFTLKLDSQNRVEIVEMEENSYLYSYSETGYLNKVALCNSEETEIFYETLDYDDSGKLVQIIQYPDKEHISNYQMEYNDAGKLKKVTVSDRDQNITQDTVYEYKQDGQLDYYVLRFYSIFSEEADDVIMVYVPVYDKYGVIEQYTLGQAVYIPGTYTGTADGFGGEVTVEVTVDYMQITNVEVIEQNETAGIGSEAFETLISEILDTGSPNVDSVTGATISSQAFLNAIDNALQEAQLYQEDSQASREVIYNELDGKTFTMASGVGNWSTEITFDEGGLFQGSYYDFDMGDTAAEYPNGTCYVSNFNGTMGNIGQIDEYTYSMEIVDLFFDMLANGEEITDGVRYVEVPYDIEYGDAFELYYPGRSTADLSEEFITWLRMPLAWEDTPEILPVYGLYSLRNGDSFFCNNG